MSTEPPATDGVSVVDNISCSTHFTFLGHPRAEQPLVLNFVSMCCASPWSIVLVATSCLFGCATATAQAPRELSRSWTNDLADPVATPPIEERGEKQHSTEELRRTIDAKVLDRLTRSIEDHVHLVETGERAARPFVTLTYAQSIDGSIAAADKSQVTSEMAVQCVKALSCQDSLHRWSNVILYTFLHRTRL